MFEVLLAAFSIIAITELGDRTQVAALFLGARYHKHHRKVFAGSVAAFAVLFLVSVLLGNAVLSYIPENIVRLFSAFSFIAIGVYTLLKKENEGVKIKKGNEPFVASFSIMLFSEIGDKTQIAVVLLAARFQDAASTFFGALSAEMMLTGAAIFAGKHIAKRIEMRRIKYLSGAVFILFGLISVLRF